MMRSLRQVFAATSGRRTAKRCRRRRFSVERLEARNLLAAIPFGAAPGDTTEYLLGSVLVTPVAFESDGSSFPNDPNTEDWDESQIAELKSKLEEGLQWWSDTLDALDTVHSLQFKFDWTYVDNPVSTGFEPISRKSNDYTKWVNDFLDEAGFNETFQTVHEDVQDFNHAQREKHETNWAFTIFVANSENDSDGKFAPNGSFSQAFAFAESKFFVMPSTRPASTVAHETGHMGYAFDEYVGGAPHTARRGYYNAENANAFRSGDDTFVQQESIMTSGQFMQNAYDANTSPLSTLALVGWQDSDNDGVFDVLDVPHDLQAFGIYDAASQVYRFEGFAEVATLPNQNSAGLQNDITINKIDRLSFRVDGGDWQTASTYNAYQTNVQASVPLPDGEFEEIEFRTETLDPVTSKIVTTSPIFRGNPFQASYTSDAGLSGAIYSDYDEDGVFNGRDVGIPGRVVKLQDVQNGQEIVLKQVVEPDDHEDNVLLNNVHPGVVLTSEGSGVSEDDVYSSERDTSSTGDRVFAHVMFGTSLSAEWTANARELRMEFDPLVSRVSLDAVGNVFEPGMFDYGRLEAYDSDGNMLERYSTGPLADGDVETMVIERGTADIAYAIAYGSNGTAVRLDNLEFGPETQTLTDNNGVYRFPGIPTGQYLVVNEAPEGSEPTSPLEPNHEVALIDSHVTDLNFGFEYHRPFQNPDDRFDVDGLSGLTPHDVGLVASNIHVHGIRRLPSVSDQQPAPFVDINGDGQVSPGDLAQLVQRLIQETEGTGENEWSPNPAGSRDGGTTPDAPQLSAGGELDALGTMNTNLSSLGRTGLNGEGLDAEAGRLHDQGLEDYLREVTPPHLFSVGRSSVVSSFATPHFLEILENVPGNASRLHHETHQDASQDELSQWETDDRTVAVRTGSNIERLFASEQSSRWSRWLQRIAEQAVAEWGDSEEWADSDRDSESELS